MLAIFRKEVKSYFYSPIAYTLMGLFIFVASVLFYAFNLASGYGDVKWIFSHWIFILVLIIFSSIITMRIIAEDRKNGTEVLLITSPVRLTDIVLGKFLAAFSVFLAMTAITFIYPLIVVAYGGQFTADVLGGYIGFIFLGASFISVGVFASSLSENQIISVVISFTTLLSMWLLGAISSAFGGFIGKILDWISILTRYEQFVSGILDLSSVVYYISFVAVFLFLTIRVIDKRRWSRG